jgi:hypothetical protein
MLPASVQSTRINLIQAVTNLKSFNSAHKVELKPQPYRNVKHDAIKTYQEVEVQLHFFLTLEINK